MKNRKFRWGICNHDSRFFKNWIWPL